MANISIQEALKRVMQTVKKYIDDNTIEIEHDGLSISGIIDNQYPSLETEDDTLIGAINELHAEALIQNEIVNITDNELNNILKDVYDNEEE